jgi:hypothetical protein
MHRGAEAPETISMAFGGSHACGEAEPDSYCCDLSIADGNPMAIRGAAPLEALANAVNVARTFAAQSGATLIWLDG